VSQENKTWTLTERVGQYNHSADQTLFVYLNRNCPSAMFYISKREFVKVLKKFNSEKSLFPKIIITEENDKELPVLYPSHLKSNPDPVSVASIAYENWCKRRQSQKLISRNAIKNQTAFEEESEKTLQNYIKGDGSLYNGVIKYENIFLHV
jgi:hypothetical protein